MPIRPLINACIIAALALGSAAGAHHSISGQFDSDQQVRLTGVISKIDWINPHTNIYVDVTGEDGSVTTWRLVSLPTAMMRKAGMTSTMIRGDGATVAVDALLARDGTANLGYLLRIDYPDGHNYQFATSD